MNSIDTLAVSFSFSSLSGRDLIWEGTDWEEAVDVSDFVVESNAIS